MLQFTGHKVPTKTKSNTNRTKATPATQQPLLGYLLEDLTLDLEEKINNFMSLKIQ